jgi:hypothetical protein
MARPSNWVITTPSFPNKWRKKRGKERLIMLRKTLSLLLFFVISRFRNCTVQKQASACRFICEHQSAPVQNNWDIESNDGRHADADWPECKPSTPAEIHNPTAGPIIF